MTKSILALTLALGLSAGLAGAARADDMNGTSATQLAAAQQQEQTTQTAATAAYNRNVNPIATVHSTGVYDQEDLYRDANGNPLPGDAEMFGEGSSQ